MLNNCIKFLSSPLRLMQVLRQLQSTACCTSSSDLKVFPPIASPAGPRTVAGQRFTSRNNSLQKKKKPSLSASTRHKSPWPASTRGSFKPGVSCSGTPADSFLELDHIVDDVVCGIKTDLFRTATISKIHRHSTIFQQCSNFARKV